MSHFRPFPRSWSVWLLVLFLAQPFSRLHADDLSAARNELMMLQQRYGENHPAVVDQELRVKVLVQLAQDVPDEPSVLRLAQVELAVMLTHYAENHPKLRSQVVRVKKMQEKVAADPAMPPELLTAWGELAVV